MRNPNLDGWTSGLDLWGGLVSVFLEVLNKLTSQRADLLLERSLTLGPCVDRIEKLRWNTWTGLWNMQVEHRELLVLDLAQRTVVDGIQNGSGVLQWTSLATSSGRGTSPTSIEQPSVGIVLGDLVRSDNC